MTTGFIKLFLSFCLIIFLIGGGRVCGCDVFSWAGFKVNQIESKCADKTKGHHHHSEGRDENHNDDRCHHSHPYSGGNCCEESLKPIIADVPKILILPNLSLDDVKTHSVATNPFIASNSEGAVVVWNTASRAFRNHSETRLFQQRFNI